MDLLFIADPLEHFTSYDSTLVMMQEAHDRGFTISACQPHDIRWSLGECVSAAVQGIRLTGRAEEWFVTTGSCRSELRSFDAVLMRKDPPFDLEYIHSTHLLEQAEREGARVFNSPAGQRAHSDKLAILEFPQFIAPTLVTRREADLRAFHAEHGDIILKPLVGMGGRGIFRIRPDGMNLGVAIETLNRGGARTVMAQQFLPGISEGDKRVILIDGEPAPLVLARIPQGDEVRGNLSSGGKGVVMAISEREREIAKAVGPTLAQRGQLFVGLDVIDGHLTEMNVTSPTGMWQISYRTGFDAGSVFMDALQSACARRHERSR